MANTEKLKKLEQFDNQFEIPAYETELAAGADIRACLPEGSTGKTLTIQPGQRTLVPTGLAMEIPAGFEIQMGTAGGGFNTVSFIDGAGDATEPTTYEFTTDPLISGSYVFRIKQIDYDGQISLSPMVETTIGTDLAINMAHLCIFVRCLIAAASDF